MVDETSCHRRERNVKSLAVGFVIVLIGVADVRVQPHRIAQDSPAAQFQTRGTTEGRRNSRLIAHIEHNGLSFSVAIDSADESRLKILIPEKTELFETSERPVVRLKVLMRNDKIIEGRAEPAPGWLESGGYVDVTYRFRLGKGTTVDEIHSGTIWIGDERFALFPF